MCPTIFKTVTRMSDVPAVQRYSHGLLVVFLSFATWFPEAPVDERHHISVRARMIKPQTTWLPKVALPKVWEPFFRFPCWWGLIGLLWNDTDIINSTAGSSVMQHLDCFSLQTFGLLALAFGLPLLCVTHKSWAGMGWQGLLRRGQWASTTLNTLPQRGWWAAGELCLGPEPIPGLPRIIFWSISRKADGHREGQALLDGPPPPPGRFLLLLFFFSFLKDQNL